MLEPFAILPFLVLAYMMGSIPSGWLLMRLTGRGDVTQHGSGGTGATNVLRHSNRFLGFVTLACDILKTQLAILGVLTFMPMLYTGSLHTTTLVGITGLTVIVGHAHSLWLGGRGGKGVACFLGGLAMLCPWLAGLYMLVWYAIFRASRYVSVASMTAAWVAVVLTPWFVGWMATGWLGLWALWMVWLHRGNVTRLLRGQELRFHASDSRPQKNPRMRGVPCNDN